MAAIKKADMLEQRQEAPTLKSENNAASSQPLKVQHQTIADKKDSLPKVRLLKSSIRGEPCPEELRKTANEVKIQKLREQTASQSNEMNNFKRQLAEAEEALARQKEATNQLHVEVKSQKQIITNKRIEARHFETQVKKQENEKEAAISELSKSEEDKIELNAMLESVQKEGLKINQTLTEEKNKGEDLTRKLTEFQNKVGVLQSETAGLHDTVVTLQNEVAGLKSKKEKLKDTNEKQKFEIELSGQMIKKMQSQMCSVIFDYEEQKENLEREISEYKLTEEKYKVRLWKVAKKLEKAKAKTETTCKRLRTYKLGSERRGKIIEADKETKVEMEENLVALMKENVKLKKELNSGFIGRYQQIKRFFGRVVHAIFRY